MGRVVFFCSHNCLLVSWLVTQSIIGQPYHISLPKTHLKLDSLLLGVSTCKAVDYCGCDMLSPACQSAFLAAIFCVFLGVGNHSSFSLIFNQVLAAAACCRVCGDWNSLIASCQSNPQCVAFSYDGSCGLLKRAPGPTKYRSVSWLPACLQVVWPGLQIQVQMMDI